MTNQTVVSPDQPQKDHARPEQVLTCIDFQGLVYQKIIEDVVDNCGVMFEEEGVERKLIDEMAEVGTFHILLWRLRFPYLYSYSFCKCHAMHPLHPSLMMDGRTDWPNAALDFRAQAKRAAWGRVVRGI